MGCSVKLRGPIGTTPSVKPAAEFGVGWCSRPISLAETFRFEAGYVRGDITGKHGLAREGR